MPVAAGGIVEVLQVERDVCAQPVWPAGDLVAPCAGESRVQSGGGLKKQGDIRLLGTPGQHPGRIGQAEQYVRVARQVLRRLQQQWNGSGEVVAPVVILPRAGVRATRLGGELQLA